MLKVEINKTLGRFELKSSFAVDGGVLGILGPSGCGKSMTLKCIAGLIRPDSGFIQINGRELYHSASDVFVSPRNRNIGYVFQHHALFPHLTVYNNVAYGIRHLSKELQSHKISEILEKTHMTGYEKHYPSQLSGGQQQRVALSRTLITEPDLLLLDEPLSALDRHVKSLVEYELLEIIRKNFSGTVIMVTHDVEEAYRMCDTILIMDHGQSMQIGEKNHILQKPASLTAARIAGCSNLFNAQCITEESGQWIIQAGSLKLCAEKSGTRVASPLTVGIHSHDLSLFLNHQREENTFPCTVTKVIDSIFYSLVSIDCHGISLQVEIAKHDWSSLSDNQSPQMFVHIPASKLFLLDR